MTAKEYRFPPVEYADPEGLLAIGGDLMPERVFAAHKSGIFPWYNDIDNILWWAPPIRTILPTAHFHASRTLKKLARRHDWHLTLDTAFDDVIRACRRPESWLDDHMIAAYNALHGQGRAHSCELWAGDELIGGVYGVCLEHIFCAESMFSARASASTLALAALARHLLALGVAIIDTQFMTAHLRGLGAIDIPRDDYQRLLTPHPDRHRGRWQIAPACARTSLLWQATKPR
ncbi:MAG: leucyl/phenylalanyl-tRNA--protein transferase [Cardiobacteriaceae bacterium]|nr:leucyl/phenylalanyl-tRNA--protein transferase [Cardiobacteriaceae bacterium]